MAAAYDRRSHPVTGEPERPRARVDALVALVGVEGVGDEELGRGRGHAAVGLDAGVPVAARERRLAAAADAGRRGAAADDRVGRYVLAVELGPALGEPAPAADVPAERQLVRAGREVAAE